MSRYEDYTATAGSYDETRVPIGVELILGCLASGSRPLGELRVLDAGCGTGSYAAELAPHVAHVHAVDLNEAMLDIARRKLATRGNVSFQRADMQSLSLEQPVDAIVVNQALHHMDATAAIPNLARLLAPGGVLVVNTCSQRQILYGFWMSALVPEAATAMAARYVPLDALERIFTDAGLTARGRLVPVDALLSDAYFDGRGPLRKAWRDGDSLWSLASSDELGRALQTVRDLDARGELDAFVAHHDAERPNIGQVTFMWATRARSS